VSLVLLALLGWTPRSVRSDTLYDNDLPDGKMAMAAHPEGHSLIEKETADDFLLTDAASIDGGTFTGLIPLEASVDEVVVEIYRVFPKDSTDPPSGNVPTRVNSPSDVAFESRDASSGLTFQTTFVDPSFDALNSVVDGIHPIPNQTTGGEGPVSKGEVRIDFALSQPIMLPADHYFFVAQVDLGGAGGQFLWLSAPKPATQTPFTPDLQAWIRDGNLDPDWLRVGTDIVGGEPAPTFNAAFSLLGVLPEPGAPLLAATALVALAGLRRSRS
jgi:hypothetical protein